jgi:hypothetical protein
VESAEWVEASVDGGLDDLLGFTLYPMLAAALLQTDGVLSLG